MAVLALPLENFDNRGSGACVLTSAERSIKKKEEEEEKSGF